MDAQFETRIRISNMIGEGHESATNRHGEMLRFAGEAVIYPRFCISWDVLPFLRIPIQSCANVAITLQSSLICEATWLVARSAGATWVQCVIGIAFVEPGKTLRGPFLAE
jgi:hypothetical protein